MKIRSVLTLVGLAISFALPTFAQQKDTPDPQRRAALVAFEKNEMEAWNNNDADTLAALFTEDAVLVTDTGPIYGREAIEKYYAELFQKMHFSNYLITPDQYSPHAIGTAGNEDWATGEWSLTVKGQNWGPKEFKGFWSAIHAREGDVWKNRMVTANITPAPAATGTAQQTNTPDPKLREQLIEAVKKHNDGFVKGDAASLGSDYTDDAVQVNDFGPIYGREAIQKHYEDLFKNVHFTKHVATLDQNSPYMSPAGDTMWIIGDWTSTVEGQTPGGQHFGPLDEKGFFTTVFVRQGDDWKAQLETWNRLKIYQ